MMRPKAPRPVMDFLTFWGHDGWPQGSDEHFSQWLGNSQMDFYCNDWNGSSSSNGVLGSTHSVFWWPVLKMIK